MATIVLEITEEEETTIIDSLHSYIRDLYKQRDKAKDSKVYDTVVKEIDMVLSLLKELGEEPIDI